MVRQGRGAERVVEVSAKNAWRKKNCLTPAFLAHTGFFFKISNYQCPLPPDAKKKKKKKMQIIFKTNLASPPSEIKQWSTPLGVSTLNTTKSAEEVHKKENL